MGAVITLSAAMSYAIIRSGGKQFRVEAGQAIRMPTIAADPGSPVTFGDVAFASDGSNVRVGAPAVSGAQVAGEIVRHGRGPKIVVFKMKRRKNYAKKQG